MDVSEDSILDQHSNALRVVEKLKKEIQCDGDVCRPIGLIPTKHYNSYVDVMKKNFADTETRVLKQRQFSSMCNKLFEDRSDYVYHASTVKHTPNAPFFHQGGGNCTLNLGRVWLNPEDVQTVQKHAFFILREMGKVATEFCVRVDISEMSTLFTLRFYLNSAGGAHVIGYLMHASTEAPIKSITIVTANRLQRACAKLILKTISKLEEVIFE